MTTSTGTITVIIFSPNHPDSKRFEWGVAHTIGRAAIEAAKAFGICVGEMTPTFLNESGEVLDLTSSFADSGVCEGDKLELVTSGGGV